MRKPLPARPLACPSPRLSAHGPAHIRARGLLPKQALACVVLAASALGPVPAHAFDAAHEPATSPARRPVAAKAEARKAAAAEAAQAAGVAAAPPAADPMQVLRERLAERLASAKAGATGSTATLRVVSVAPTAPAALRPASAHNLAAAHGVATPRTKLVANAAGHAMAHWSYAGEVGPQAWGGMKPEFSLCAKGERQSPIDIREGIAVDLEPVKFNYQPSGFSVIDNGHTVQVNLAPGNSIEVSGKRFELLQFHFHRPSEERIDGRQFDLSAHLVHKDPEGRLAVVAVLLGRGTLQPVVQTVWNNLPLEKNQEMPARATLDPAQLLPADRRYYTYMGSLTTPPCSEGVQWVVMRQPVGAAPEQIDIFSRLYPMNARPIQSGSGRRILQSN